MVSTKKRLKEPKDLVVMSDGHKSYESLFASVFGEPYRPARKGDRGRFAGMRHRVKRSLAHLQLIKRRQGGRVVEVLCRVAHGSWKRVQRELERLGYKEPNLWAIERQNGTSRRMNAYSGQKEPGLREKRGESGGSWMVEYGPLQLLSPTKRALRVPSGDSEGRRRYERRTPAMAAKLSDFIWTVADLLCTMVYPTGGTG
jgi:hypothetical protein